MTEALSTEATYIVADSPFFRLSGMGTHRTSGLNIGDKVKVRSSQGRPDAQGDVYVERPGRDPYFFHVNAGCLKEEGAPSAADSHVDAIAVDALRKAAEAVGGAPHFDKFLAIARAIEAGI